MSSVSDFVTGCSRLLRHAWAGHQRDAAFGALHKNEKPYTDMRRKRVADSERRGPESETVLGRWVLAMRS